VVVFEGLPLSARMRTRSRAAHPPERRRLAWSGAFPLSAPARYAGAQPQALALKGRQRNNVMSYPL
jgi:hypothetical protein